MKLKKKGFTIIELVIVIAVIGVLTAILIPTFMGITDKAHQAENETFVRNINTQLAINEASGDKNRTMHEAVKDAQSMGFHVDQITPYNGNDIIWDSVHDRFAIVKSNFATAENKAASVVYADGSFDPNTKPYKLWKMYDVIPTTQLYSIYAKTKENWASNSVDLSVGFDVGENTNFTSINYVHNAAQENAQEVAIRTNSANTELTVNGLYDTVKHYDSVGKVHVIAVDKIHCYEENGKAAFTQVDSGKYKTVSKSDVELLFVSDSSNVNLEIAPGTVDHAHAISEAAANAINETNPGITFDYDGNSDQAALDVYLHVAAEDQIGLTVDYSENKTKDAVQVAVNEALENSVFKGVAVSKAGQETQLITIEAFRDSVNSGNTYAGYTVKLLDTIDLTGVEWTPLKLFAGTFDGNNKTLSGLKVSATTDISSGSVDIGFFEKTENATIKNLTISGFEIYGTGRIASGAIIGNASNGLTLRGVTLTSSNKLTGKWSGGFVGKTSVTKEGTNKRDCKFIIENCHSSVDIVGERTGGFIGQMDGSDNTIYNSSNGFATFASCSFDGKLNANTGTAMAAGFVAQQTNGNRTSFVYTYQNCSVNNANIASSGSLGDFTAVSQSAYSLFGCRVNDAAVALPTDVNFAFCNSITVYAYSINGTIYAIKAASSGYGNVTSNVIGSDVQIAGNSDHSISLSDVTDWHKVTNASTDFYGNYIVSADASAIYRAVPSNLEEGTKLQRRTYVAGHDYSAKQDTYGFDMWRIVNNDVPAEGTGFGQWQDVGLDGAAGFVLGEGIYYYDDPTEFVDTDIYNVSSRATSDGWKIYTVAAK